MTTNGPPPFLTPPHPALAPVKDETLRLLMADEEGDFIAARIKRCKRWIAVAAVVGLTAPLIPTALFWDEARLFEGLFAYHHLAGGAGIFATLFGVVAPMWALVRGGIEVGMLRRYRDYQAEHTAFLARHNRCPADFRRARADTGR